MLRLGLWALAGGVALLFALRTFVGGVYRVESPSMEPAVHGSPTGGDRLLVTYGGAREITRFDLIVVRRPGEKVPLVKRVAGLAGERLQLSGGDLLVNGRRLGPDVPRPAPVLVFDDTLLTLSEYFHMRSEPEGPWQPTAEGWHLDGTRVSRGSDLGMALYSKKLTDGWLTEDGRREPGLFPVNDALLECEVRLGEGTGLVRLRLLEAGDTFEAELEPGGDESDPSAGMARITRRTGSATWEVVAEAPVALPRGEWIALAFANVDDTLRLDVGGERISTFSYQGNTPYLGEPPLGVPSEVSRTRAVGPPVAFGGEGLGLEFRRVRVLRDLYYTPLGAHGIERPVSLGPGELFLLGDNSAHSRDSREWGPVRMDQALGRPRAVVWPPGRWKCLGGAVEPGTPPAR